MKIDLEELYGYEILQLWGYNKGLPVFTEEYSYRRIPLLPKYVEKDTILFVGLNPSYDEKHKNIIFYRRKEGKDISYFEKIKEVANYCNNGEYEHIDLFFLRETKQKVIESLVFKKEGRKFLQDQLDISFKIIKKINPKIIIVTNAFASEFFGKKKATKHSTFNKIWMGYDLDFEKDFDNTIGTYSILMNERQIPIVFSGMLSGQRALDLGSLERLKWQLKFILDKK